MDIADLLYTFKESRGNLSVPDMSDPFIKKLYSTYLSYLPEDQFSYPLKMNIDDRGSFTEILRTQDRGQMSVNITKPGITKGNHWHQMCIRDRLIHRNRRGTRQPPPLQRTRREPLRLLEDDVRMRESLLQKAWKSRSLQTLPDGGRPVSYTHLDVYKRQVRRAVRPSASPVSSRRPRSEPAPVRPPSCRCV